LSAAGNWLAWRGEGERGEGERGEGEVREKGKECYEYTLGLFFDSLREESKSKMIFFLPKASRKPSLIMESLKLLSKL
jgi:hypothetical protein